MGAMVPEAKVSIPFLFFECNECGAVYGITAQCFDHRTRDGRAIHCPNGHELHVRNNANGECPVEEAQRLRGELVQVRHQLEQTEAQLSTDRPAERPGRLQCPYCDRRYKSRHCAVKHVMKEHREQFEADGLDPKFGR